MSVMVLDAANSNIWVTFNQNLEYGLSNYFSYAIQNFFW
jgi:hypothetical protein